MALAVNIDVASELRHLHRRPLATLLTRADHGVLLRVRHAIVHECCVIRAHLGDDGNHANMCFKRMFGRLRIVESPAKVSANVVAATQTPLTLAAIDRFPV